MSQICLVLALVLAAVAAAGLPSSVNLVALALAAYFLSLLLGAH